MTPTKDGPVLLEGPVEVTLDDGSTVTSDRFVVALCACRRSRTYPWCDTSHRRRVRDSAGRGPHTGRPAAGQDESARRAGPDAGRTADETAARIADPSGEAAE
ncbi:MULTISPECIES: CDGSH iron-sulfur domain-containing protein [unclassified Streptomyces]|uniref:CDGSH iron-sulfur domain-containing protein n=1 Tax=unclassified Streptomyces TaxID=2593676 RepID=UPI00073C584F|nr:MULTISPECIES: CDGSH iron-sulfur domain-containing protein [unclassified Streptomyces]ODA74808.1 Iron-binding zinc finger CDGSH type [Streptomyces sp. AVP053U2]